MIWILDMMRLCDYESSGSAPGRRIIAKLQGKMFKRRRGVWHEAALVNAMRIRCRILGGQRKIDERKAKEEEGGRKQETAF